MPPVAPAAAPLCGKVTEPSPFDHDSKPALVLFSLPGGTQMTNVELNKIRKILEARIIDLERSARRRDSITIEDAADPLDRRMQATEREFAVRGLEAESARLHTPRSEEHTSELQSHS